MDSAVVYLCWSTHYLDISREMFGLVGGRGQSGGWRRMHLKGVNGWVQGGGWRRINLKGVNG